MKLLPQTPHIILQAEFITQKQLPCEGGTKANQNIRAFTDVSTSAIEITCAMKKPSVLFSFIAACLSHYSLIKMP